MAKLYIVPTPIGNLDDITLRAVNVLRDVDFILAEDTRTTSFLLKHLGIEKKLYSHHKFNEHATVKMVAESIAAGRNAALVSDAGTPLDTTLVCVVTPKPPADSIDRTTLASWLRIRTKVDNVKLFVEP